MGSEDWGQSSPSFPGFDLSLEQIIEKTARLVSENAQNWSFLDKKIHKFSFKDRVFDGFWN